MADAAQESFPEQHALVPKQSEGGRRRKEKVVKAASSAKPKTSAKTKPEPKAKAASSRGRKTKKAIDVALESDHRCDAVIAALMGWAHKFNDEEFEHEHKLDAYKAAVRAELAPLKSHKLNIYWSRNAAGVTSLRPAESPVKRRRGKKKGDCTPAKRKTQDVHHFGFSSTSVGGDAPFRFKTAMAVRCAELAAPWNIHK